ncbi:G-type lectin S-receptor-like serine/threonine-protein kinase RKS1 [Morus notabilis]|uniref:Receptor-like serine/threonine-protein kinase n=1 Tax=Morus notabilis TaxID=981085 RepID=W9S6T4_9ROSA|nr:G-type lectin S-receptor-like serine/threonine-protein kinase RKS1 [Morus notabilis]
MKSLEAFLDTILILLIFVYQPFCLSLVLDSITPNNTVKDGDVLLSGQKTFALGFFSPGKSRYRYVGIWYYKDPEKTAVWVANRDDPINETSGVLAIDSKGRLIIYAKDQNSPIWSANVSVPSEKSSSSFIAKLLDVGNLVLIKQDNSTVIWQSFDYPTNTYLPFMKLGLNRKSGLNRFISSWKSADDPGTGNCTYRIDSTGYPQMFAYKNRVPFWRAGSWTGQRWSGVSTMTNGFLDNTSYVNNQDEISVMYGISTDSNSVFSRFVIEESETVRQFTWQDQGHEWVESWYAPNDWCDSYKRCGGNGNCDPSDVSRFECVCLPGFEPRSQKSWELRDASGGCMRKGGARTCEGREGFLKMTRVKLPDTSNALVEMGLSLRECKKKCLKDCNCTAYTSVDETKDGVGCLSWHGDLVDVKTYSNTGFDLYIRVDATTLVKESQSKTLLGNIPPETFLKESDLGDDRADSDVPLFDLHTIAAATANFSVDNKLGQGGFGSVYKGILSNGKEIAVKRLSKCSGQGSQEFKNEVMLIAKLQHRNLVRILGCCIEEKEKMIVYEYLPNKSLDCFIFDGEKRKSLDWQKLFNIICGVARGMLYLHHDSRLRIIHRDLKASNVLLDTAMNPKIADFGMARIFGGEQIEADTNRVVGTYGYMSPEYAMEGRFSIKSDVYSFGVLLLEIIAGKKNTIYYENFDSNLVGHVWDLWIEGKALEIMDSSLDKSYASEALRCIIIGLLCVQELATDRPTMSAVVSMLGNDSALPRPKQPAFVCKRSYTSGDPSTSGGAKSVTCTEVEAR